MRETEELCSSVLEHVSDVFGLWFEKPNATTASRGDRYEIAISGAVRFVGALDTPWATWWSQRPVGGSGGRSGLAPGPDAAEGTLDVPHQVARSLEEVLWDDPALLLDADQFLYERPDALDAASWATVLRRLLARRIPLDLETLDVVARQLDPRSTPAVWLEQLSYRLRTYEIVVRIGEGLHDELAPQNAAGRFTGELAPYLHSGLFTELGVGFSELTFIRASELQGRSFEILVCGLRRAGGTVPAASTLVNLDPGAARSWLGAASDGRGVVNPASGALNSWVSSDEAGALAGSGGVTWDPAEFVILQLAAVLREAAAEFADLAWTHQMCDQLRVSGDGELVALLDRRFARETVAGILHRLAAERVPIRDMPLVVERMLDFAAARAVQVPDIDEDEVSLGEHVRRGSRRRLIQDAVMEVSWDTADEGGLPLRSARRPIDTITFGSELEAGLGTALAGKQPEDVYSLSSGAAILDAMRRELEGRGTNTPVPALVVPRPVRPHIRRLVAAQFPRVRVFARDEFPPDVVDSNVSILVAEEEDVS